MNAGADHWDLDQDMMTKNERKGWDIGRPYRVNTQLMNYLLLVFISFLSCKHQIFFIAIQDVLHEDLLNHLCHLIGLVTHS